MIFNRASRSIQQATPRVRGFNEGIGCLIFCFVIGGIIAGGWQFYQHERRMSFMPSEWVTGIAYGIESDGKIGPGGNEAGLLVFNLTNDVAATITKEGLAFFDRPENIDRRIGHQQRSQWQSSPILNDGRWVRRLSAPGSPAKIDDRNWLGLSIDPVVKKSIDEILSKSGRFYSYGRLGDVVIIAPEERKAIFAYEH